MLTCNAFTMDTDGERTERVVLLSANIGAVSVELGLPAAKVTEAEAAQTDWDDALSAATREAGESHEATEELNSAITAAYDYYVAAKAHLVAVIYEMEYPDKIIDAYGFNVDAPTDYHGLHNALKAWIDEHAVLTAAGDPRVVNATIIANLTAHYDAIDTLYRARSDEKDEAIRATEAKRATFVRHSKLLKHIWTLACLTWGDDASQLRLLGFVPSSEIWTPGGGGDKLPAVTGFGLEFLDPELRIYWDAVEGADGYLVKMGNNPLILTTTVYDGTDTEFTFDPPGGHLYFRVWAKDGEDLGEPGDAIDIEITGTPPGPPKNLVLSYDGTYVHANWEEPDSGTPEFFRLYAKTVPTGTGVPVRPSEPEYDELITLSVGMFAPGPGNTVYVWVSAFGDGEEGESVGPESIDIM